MKEIPRLTAISDVHKVRLSRRSCMIRVLSLYESSPNVSNSAIASSKACNRNTLVSFTIAIYPYSAFCNENLFYYRFWVKQTSVNRVQVHSCMHTNNIKDSNWSFDGKKRFLLDVIVFLALKLKALQQHWELLCSYEICFN